jgi:hypothetical protein
MVISSTSAVEVSIHAVSPVSIVVAGLATIVSMRVVGS